MLGVKKSIRYLHSGLCTSVFFLMNKSGLLTKYYITLLSACNELQTRETEMQVKKKLCSLQSGTSDRF